MAPRPPTRRAWARGSRLPELGPGTAVVVLGLISAIAWGTGDFGGGLLSRRAPLLAVVGVTQAVGIVGALVLAISLGEPFPSPPDIGLSIGAGLCGMAGITMLYRGLAVGRMGVVAPVTGVIGAVIPVVVGFAFQGAPQPIVIAGIVTALVSVVLVTRAPGHQAGHPSGIAWALGAGLAIGGFNLFIASFSGEAALGPLVIVRLVQAILMALIIVAWRQPWRMGRDVVGRLVVIGLLDMAGNAAFIVATQTGMLAVAAVLSSLYPVMTVVLAIAILHERLTRSHVLGIALTVAAIAMIGIGSTAT
jgi:drug/metabolite transporter (DMT)-like permease